MIDPDEGVDPYPATTPTVYEYVPVGSEKEMDVEVDDCVVPARVTDQLVPVGSPVSEKVTVQGLQPLPHDEPQSIIDGATPCEAPGRAWDALTARLPYPANTMTRTTALTIVHLAPLVLNIPLDTPLCVAPLRHDMREP